MGKKILIWHLTSEETMSLVALAKKNARHATSVFYYEINTKGYCSVYQSNQC